MRTISDLADFLSQQPRIMSVLRPVAMIGIEDCWVGAGLIRNAVWDHLHGRPVEFVSGSDVDVVYCDCAAASLARDLEIEKRLFEALPDVPWSVHNQARMHERNGDAPYRDTEDAIRHWPETATAIAARLNGDRVEVIAPHGIDDLLQLRVRPTPTFGRKLEIYRQRIASKDWLQRWPMLEIVGP